MDVQIIKDKDNNPIGWSLTAPNKEEMSKLIDIRNLQFFGFDDTNIKYNGRSGGDDKNFDVGTLSWKQKKHC